MDFSFDPKQATGAAAKIRALERRASKPSPVMWNRIGTFMRLNYRKQFSTRGAFLGTPWKPLKPKTLAWKVRHGYGTRILVNTGELRRSYVDKTEALMEPAGDNAYVYGSKNRLAVFHQRGTHSHSSGKQLIPARKVIVKNDYVKDGVRKIMVGYISGGKKREETGALE